MSDYPKYQYSKFDSEGGQIVIRTDDGLEAEGLIEWAKKIAEPKEKTVALSQEPSPTREIDEAFPAGPTEMCPAHEIWMKQGIAKSTGKPYHSHINEKGERCFGRGYLPKKS